MRYAWLVLGIFFARFVTDAIAFPAGDGDLAWQNWLGRQILTSHAIPRALGAETFSAPGAPWTPQEWAFALGVTFAKSGNVQWIVFASLVALGTILALVLVARTCLLLEASPVWTAVGTALAGVAIVQSFGVRAQVAAWPLVAALMFLVQLRDRRVWWIVALTALWSNLHASVLLAPVVTLLVTAGAWLDGRFRITPEVRRLALVTLASIAATCCNPFGAGLPIYAVRLFGDTVVRGLINEWRPTHLDDASFGLGALLVLLGAVVAGLGKRASWRDVLVVCAFAFLLLGAARNIGVFAIATAPLAAAAVSARIRGAFPSSAIPREPSRRDRIIGGVALPAIGFALVLVVAIGLLGSVQKSGEPGLQRAARALAASSDRNLLCEDFAWCSSFLATNERDFLDGRADPFPDDVWIAYGKVLRISPGWQDVIKTYGVNAIIAHRDGPLSMALASAGGWHSIYRDDEYDVLTR